MSRSIHATHRVFDEVRRSSFADPKKRAERLKHIRVSLAKKRRIKYAVAKQRVWAALRTLPTATETVPIIVRDGSPVVHYPASPEDILAVMRRLPKGVTDGLSAIHLSLGAEEQADPDEPICQQPDPDPLTGRRGFELWKGLYTGRVLGQYLPQSAVIQVFAYVNDADMPYRDVLELYLRLCMLSTFVHEVAHHVDHTSRIARGRWLADCEDKGEIHAERLQHEWIQTCVVPYLEATYHEQAEILRSWVRDRGGIALSLSFLAGDPRATAKGGLISINNGIFGVRQSFESLVGSVLDGEDPLSTRLGFARNLHYGEHYEQALQILAGVLAEHANHLEALTLQADVYAHQERFDLAQHLAERVISADPLCVAAWDVLADIFEARQEWRSLSEAATRLVDLYETDASMRKFALRHRARARLELGDFVGLEADLAELTNLHNRWADRVASQIRAETLERQTAPVDGR